MAQPDRSGAVLTVEQIWTLEWYWGLAKGALPTKSKLNSFESEQLAIQLFAADISRPSASRHAKSLQ